MKTACPFCNSEFEVEQRFENQETKCPSCGNDFIITPCEDKPKLVAISPMQAQKNTKLCPECQRSISVSSETCPCCGHVFVETSISTLLVVILWIIGLLLPFGMLIVVLITSILYYAWKNVSPKKAKKINKCGWMIFFTSTVVQAILFVAVSYNKKSSTGESGAERTSTRNMKVSYNKKSSTGESFVKNIKIKIFIPEQFKVKAMDFIGKANELETLAHSDSLNYILLKNKIDAVKSTYNFMLKIYPEFKDSELHNKFTEFFKGYFFALELWYLKINEYDNPCEPDINGYQEMAKYLGENAVFNIHPDDFSVSEYRNKKYIVFDKNIFAFIKIADSKYKVAEKELLKMVK